jgi:hypothetical protein
MKYFVVFEIQNFFDTAAEEPCAGLNVRVGRRALHPILFSKSNSASIPRAIPYK